MWKDLDCFFEKHWCSLGPGTRSQAGFMPLSRICLLPEPWTLPSVWLYEKKKIVCALRTIRQLNSWKSPQTLRAPSLASFWTSLPRAVCLGRAAVVGGWQPRDWGCVQVVPYYSWEAERTLTMLHNPRGNTEGYRALDQLLLISASWDLVAPCPSCLLPFHRKSPTGTAFPVIMYPWHLWIIIYRRINRIASLSLGWSS